MGGLARSTVSAWYVPAGTRSPPPALPSCDMGELWQAFLMTKVHVPSPGLAHDDTSTIAPLGGPALGPVPSRRLCPTVWSLGRRVSPGRPGNFLPPCSSRLWKALAQ